MIPKTNGVGINVLLPLIVTSVIHKIAPLHLQLSFLLQLTFALQDGRSPLHAASFKGHLDVVKTLIEAEANVNSDTKVGTHILSII